jgi:hypothetical protein
MYRPTSVNVGPIALSHFCDWGHDPFLVCGFCLVIVWVEFNPLGCLGVLLGFTKAGKNVL